LLEISVQSARVKMSYVVFTFLLLVLPGLFWFATVRRNWLPVGPTAIIGQYRIAAIAIVIAGVVVSIAAILMDLHIHDWAECHFLVPPFSRQQSPEQVVFNGRVIKTGLIWPSRLSVEQQPTILRKYWAVTIVDKHFWGLPWWDHEIVIVTLLQRSPGDFLRPGETYFIDARHRPGSLTRVLPVFETSCSRTARLEDAELDLRVLRDGNPQNGVRIIGRTVRGTFDHRSEPLPRTRVLINGPAGQIIATSDQDGIYDVSGLPPGEYAIGAQANDEQVALQHPDCIFRGWDQPAKSGDIRECLVSVK
jgi:hypothetical protein